MTVQQNVESLCVTQDDYAEFNSLLSYSFDAIKVGELISGTVTEIGRDYVVVDIGYKSDGHIPLSQFAGSDGKISIQLGDSVEVLLLSSESDTGEIVLSKDRAEQLKTWQNLEHAFEHNEVVRGTVVQKVKGGLHVDVGVPAFLPGSQIDVRPQRNLGKFVGESMSFRVLKISRDRGNIVLSRRLVLEEERETLKRDTINQLSEGIVMEGVVKNVTDYGAFIDLGGIDGLLHITDMSWGRVSHPKEVVSVGQTVPVVVLKYDRANERVSLGMKQLQINPWDLVAEKYKAGTVVNGTVVTLTDYGAFVKLDDGIEGLIHVSEMSWSKKQRKPSRIVNIGDEVSAIVLDVSSENQRISLGLKQLTPNPWEELRTQFPLGTKVRGKIRSIMDFGIFVNVKEDIDGLVHVTDLSWTKKIRNSKEIQEFFKKGDEVDAIVLEIDPDAERLSLGIKQLTTDVWEQVPQRYPSGARITGPITSVTDFGVFIELEEGVEGLVHVSQLGIQRGDDIRAKFTVGQELEAEVIAVERSERRISLSLKAAQKSAQSAPSSKKKEDYAKYMAEEDSGAVTFGDLLQKQIDNQRKE